MQGALLSDLRLPSHFAQAASTITEEEVAQAVIYSLDPARHIAAITQAAEAGYTHIWVHQIGPDQAGFSSSTPTRSCPSSISGAKTVWAAGYPGWLPTLGLMPPVWQQKAPQAIAPIAEHALYGMITVTMYDWLRERVEDPPWRSRSTRRLRRVISG